MGKGNQQRLINVSTMYKNHIACQRNMHRFPKLSSPAILSPMAGVTDVAFRALCKGYGAGLTYTEFLSSTAIARGNKKTLSMLETDPIEKPVAVQLFGSSVNDIVTAASLI